MSDYDGCLTAAALLLVMVVFFFAGWRVGTDDERHKWCAYVLSDSNATASDTLRLQQPPHDCPKDLVIR